MRYHIFRGPCVRCFVVLFCFLTNIIMSGLFIPSPPPPPPLLLLLPSKFFNICLVFCDCAVKIRKSLQWQGMGVCGVPFMIEKEKKRIKEEEKEWIMSYDIFSTCTYSFAYFFIYLNSHSHILPFCVFFFWPCIRLVGCASLPLLHCTFPLVLQLWLVEPYDTKQ
ncbi:hypothetical protein Tb927.8.3760 [Trypanosoma brucei brucei TREU927]|uniref:Uncharacterized protein n=1 Tax=Trypanosoma brucei brucei (strain 927/4 GUTat10.1) TaxID=185431 RepID=Q580Z6_TRYB2|nr:hypothetical protein Tb927.8.3760 [Trypanosoma brucei brucei TREU927]AAX78957.1 hypothetical protein Tb927.8.3760 [Trypanosoma brucei]AAZ13141.1 hypothetical protein Tb927.8.3760 [Trypanosoma brucei brucei TREU927]